MSEEALIIIVIFLAVAGFFLPFYAASLIVKRISKLLEELTSVAMSRRKLVLHVGLNYLCALLGIIALIILAFNTPAILSITCFPLLCYLYFQLTRCRTRSFFSEVHPDVQRKILVYRLQVTAAVAVILLVLLAIIVVLLAIGVSMAFSSA
jgi:type IV secretory pathway VirB3-like protein